MRTKMTAGEPSIFAIESEITQAFEKPSLRGLGFFVLHICGGCYGVKSPDATMLANSFDGVGRRVAGRGTHKAPFADVDAMDVANAYARAVYVEHDKNETFLGMTEARFKEVVNSNGLVWAPDGDEAFDDSSYVLQFDDGDRVRLVAFKRPAGSVDPASLREVSLSAEEFYGMLRQWQERFIAEWESLPKHI